MISFLVKFSKLESSSHYAHFWYERSSIEENKGRELEILLQSSSQYVEMKWDVSSFGSTHLVLINGERTEELAPTGSTTVSSGMPLKLVSSFSSTVSKPLTFALCQNYPNPFNPSTEIRYSIPDEAYVVLKIYNLLGVEIDAPVEGVQHAGEHAIQWKGQVPSGVYYYSLEAVSVAHPDRHFRQVRQMLLMK